MFTSKQILTFTYESEYETAYDLSQKKNFTAPKIYTAKGDLNKRWYVYFSFRNPQTGKLERMKNIYGIANTYKKKEDRLSVLTVYRKRLIILLKKGYNPFENNEALFEKEKTIAVKGNETKACIITILVAIKRIMLEKVKMLCLHFWKQTHQQPKLNKKLNLK